MASYITQPVALSAFAGAGLAGADPMKTGFKAMQLGVVKYTIPFFFVLNPAIALHGSPVDILISFILVSISVICISYSLEDYFPKLGLISIWMRTILFSGGLCLGFPWLRPRLIGLGLILASLILAVINKRGKCPVSTTAG